MYVLEVSEVLCHKDGMKVRNIIKLFEACGVSNCEDVKVRRTRLGVSLFGKSL